MHSRVWLTGFMVLLLTVGAGCGPTENKVGEGKGKSGKGKPAQVADSKHCGWWCDEHGVPEEVCGQCSAKVAAECKKKGDWCKEHDRPDSQCFLCHPELKEKFAAQYRAKYGKEPPPTEDEQRNPHGPGGNPPLE